MRCNNHICATWLRRVKNSSWSQIAFVLSILLILTMSFIDDPFWRAYCAVVLGVPLFWIVYSWFVQRIER